MMLVDKHAIEIKEKTLALHKEYMKSCDQVISEFSKALNSLKWKDEAELKKIDSRLQDLLKKNNQLKYAFASFLNNLDVATRAKGLKKRLETYSYNIFLDETYIKVELNKSCDLVVKLKETVLPYLSKFAPRSQAYADAVKAFDEFDRKRDYFHSVEERISDVVTSDSDQLKAMHISSKGGVFSFFHVRRQKETFSGRIGNTAVYIDVRSKFNITKDEVGGIKIHDLIISNCEKHSSKDEPEEIRSWFLAIRKKSVEQIEKDLLALVKNTLLDVLIKNQYLIRASRINLYIHVMPEKKMKDSGGYYRHGKSNFLSVFINLRLAKDFITTYLVPEEEKTPEGKIILKHKKTLPLESQPFQTMIHELTHAYDWRLNVDAEENKLASEMIGEEPEPMTLSLFKVLNKCRVEGFADTSEFINSKLHNGLEDLMFSFDELAYNLETSKDDIRKVFEEAASENAKIEKVTSGLDELSRRGTCYFLGRYMYMIILLSKLVNVFQYWMCGKDKMREKALEEQKQGNKDLLMVIQKYMWERIPFSQALHNLKKGSGLNFLLTEENKPTLHQWISAFSMMTVSKFFQEYLAACKKLKINPEPLTPENFVKMNNAKTEQGKRLLKSMGF